MKQILFKILKITGIVLGTAVGLFLALILVLTVTEFKPEAEESIEIVHPVSGVVREGDTLKVLTWNIGYAGLDETADFFMDGGKSVSSASKEEVQENVDAMIASLQSLNPDIALLQEVDVHSTRTHYIKVRDLFDEAMTEYERTTATNYKTLWVPYPIPNLGKMDCGITTYSKYAATQSTRISLPCPFTYPMSLCNLKRCLMVNRIPVEGSDKELVIVNLHLEAYDSGEGKIQQTNQLKQLLLEEAKKGNYVIAGGDFNQTFSNIDTSAFPVVDETLWMPGIIDASEFEGMQLIMDETTPSCRSLDQAYAGSDPENFQYYIIDGFIVSDNITIQRSYVEDLNFKHSDHNPLVMEIELKASR